MFVIRCDLDAATTAATAVSPAVVATGVASSIRAGAHERAGADALQAVHHDALVGA